MGKILEQAWEQRKLEIEMEIEKALVDGSSDPETLAIMKELLRSTKVRYSIEDYYRDNKD